MNHATEKQLELIREIGDALAAEGVRWWLFGGWGMDFHAGRITRDHSDIEIFVWREDAARARDALVRAGFVAPPGLYPDECQPFVKDGQELGLWFISRREDGVIVTPGRWADWPWLPSSFDGTPGRIGDLEAPVVTIDCLIDIKSNFAKHPHGAPLREKDIRDLELLRELKAQASTPRRA